MLTAQVECTPAPALSFLRGPGYPAVSTSRGADFARVRAFLVLFCHQFGRFSLVSALILDKIPIGGSLASSQTFSWRYTPSAGRPRPAPAAAGIVAPRGYDVTSPMNTGIYGRRRSSFQFRRGEMRYRGWLIAS